MDTSTEPTRTPEETIWKVDLEITDRQVIRLPAGAEMLSVQQQGPEALCLWALVDRSVPIIQHGIIIVGTGHRVPEDAEDFIGTVQVGPFVWHVFTQEGS